MTAHLRVERTGTRQGVARNARGAELRYGPDDVEGAFSPGELLLLALAACNLMSADHTLVRRLGDVGLSAQVERTKDVPQNRYTEAEVTIAVDGGDDLDDERWRELTALVDRAVERSCTVGRTLDAGMPHALAVERRTGADAPHEEET